MEYLDFELEIGLGQGRDFPVEVIRSPAGERRGTMRFPFDDLELENHLLRVQNALLQSTTTRRRIASSSDQAVQDFGQALYDALIVNDIRSCYEVSRLQADQQGKGLRIKLRVQDPGMAALPWEFLYDARQGEFMALSRYTPIVRYLDLPRAIQPLPVSPPLKILGMVASPNDLPPLNVERERQRVERAVSSLQKAGLVELTWLEGSTWQDMQRAMRKGPWHVFHFVGHGRFDKIQDEGVVALMDEDGATDELSALQLGRLLADHPSLRLVMLNACEGAKGGKSDIFSGTAATLVRRGIPAVVAMQYEITDRAAIEFARTFYEAVSDEMPLDAAVAEARKAISVSIADTVEWGTPVLFMRSPDGVLFRVQDREQARPTDTQTLPPAVVVAAPASAATEATEPFDRVAFEAELRRKWEAEEQHGGVDEGPVVNRSASVADAPAPVVEHLVPAVDEAAPADEAPGPAEPASAQLGPLPHATTPDPAFDREPTSPPVVSPPVSRPPVVPAVVAARRVEAPPIAPRPVAPAPATSTPAASPPASTTRRAPAAPAPQRSAPGSLQFTVQGRDGELLVSAAWVGIRRRPLPDPRRPDRLEPVARLIAVHLSPAGPNSNGFIQLCFQGEDSRPLKYWDAGKAGTTVVFTVPQQAQFVSAKQWLDYYVALSRRT